MLEREKVPKPPNEVVIESSSHLSVSAESWIEDVNPEKGIELIEQELQYQIADLEKLKDTDSLIPWFYLNEHEGSVDDARSAAQQDRTKRIAILELKLAKKHEEKHWALGVFGNTHLTTQDKLNQLPQFKDWLISWREHPKLTGPSHTNSLPQKLAPVLYETVSDYVQENGGLPEEFVKFIDELSDEVRNETSDEFLRGGLNSKYSIAHRFILNFTRHFSTEAGLIVDDYDQSKANARTKALISMVDHFTSTKVKILNDQRVVNAVHESWWYKTVVREGRFSNQILLERFLQYADEGSGAIFRELRFSEVHDDCVNCVLKVLDLIEDDPTRNTKGASSTRRQIIASARTSKGDVKPIHTNEIVSGVNITIAEINAVYKRANLSQRINPIDPTNHDRLPMSMLRIFEITRNSKGNIETQQKQDKNYFNLITFLTSYVRSQHDKDFLKEMAQRRNADITETLGQTAVSKGLSGRLMFPVTPRGDWNIHKPGSGKMS